LVTIAAQYLEDAPQLSKITPAAVRDRLRESFKRLPVSMLLLGWNLPQPLFAAVAEEATRLGIRLYRWQPLLTGDGVFMSRPEWQVIGLDGNPVEGFRGMPEFTFVCPNKPAVQQAVSAHLEEILLPPYQGIFLDRIRFPSPAEEPLSHLACFCKDCCRAAQESLGFDLAAFQRFLCSNLSKAEACRMLAGSLFGDTPPEMPDEVAQGLRLFYRFRCESISRFTRQAAELAHSRGLQVGLDCFASALTHMVGQDLQELARWSDWIKVMTYAHVLGPAGLPYELLGLATFLKEYAGLSEQDGLAFLEQQVGFELPASFHELRQRGLSSAALVAEIKRARQRGVQQLLAGLELVEIPGVCELNADQIKQDWRAVMGAGSQGIVLSWDLWHIPLERLDLASDILYK
jgi:hypothetical protein